MSPIANARAADDAPAVIIDTPEVRIAIGKRIADARNAVDLSNGSEFARRVGVVPATVYRWEAGTAVPDVFSLARVADVCRVTMEWIVTGAETPENDALRQWVLTPAGQTATPEAIAFLAGIRLDGYKASELFYDLAFTAWKNGLSSTEAGAAAKMTEAARRPS